MKRSVCISTRLFLIVIVISILFNSSIVFASRSDVEAFVTRFYQQCLDRNPDQAGLESWTDALLDGSQCGADVANGFIFSDEFLNRHTTNEEYLYILYHAFFNREPDSAGYNSWLSILNNGPLENRNTRKFVLEGFLYSAEFEELCGNYGIVSAFTDPDNERDDPVIPDYPDIVVYENTSRSGHIFWSKERWKGIIDITGDVNIHESSVVIIEPGTIIRFAARSDDQNEGGDTPEVDVFFPNDPVKIGSQISDILVHGGGYLYAVGTASSPIIFTSDSLNPDWGDWGSIELVGGRSKLVLKHTILEYSHTGIGISYADDSEVTIQDNIFRYIVGAGIFIIPSPGETVTLTISGNDLSYIGHEAIGAHGQWVNGIFEDSIFLIIEGNIFHDNPYAYGGVEAGGTGVAIAGNNCIIRNNRFIRNRIGIITSGDSEIYDNQFVDNLTDIMSVPFPPDV